MVHRVCWTELTDSTCYGALCVGRHLLTLTVIAHRVGWMELTDISSYGASCVLDGTD